MFLCALVGPLCPPLPTPCLLYAPFLCVRPSCRCFLFFLCSRSSLLPRALRVTSALLRVTLVPLPCAPSLACPPSHSPSRSRPCLHVCPPCPCIAVTHVCHSCALPPAPPSRPYPFRWVLPRSPPLTPSWLPDALCGGGGGSICRVCTRPCATAKDLLLQLPGHCSLAKRARRLGPQLVRCGPAT